MGNVYKARDRETRETVALKLLKPEIASDQSMMERFKNELLFARKITHKNVCRLHEFNRINGIAYTSMEFVEGESLRSVLNRFGGLPTRKAIGIIGASDLLRAEGSPRPGHRASRFEARKRHDRRPGQRENHGLRHRAVDGSSDATYRLHGRHTGLHGARASGRETRGLPHGYLFTRPDHVRSFHRRAGIPGRQRGRSRFETDAGIACSAA